MPRKELLLLIVLAAIQFTNILDFMVLMPLAPKLTRLFSISADEWGFVVASYSFAAFVSGLISIFFIDRISRKLFLMVAYGGLLVGTFICSIADSYSFLLYSRIVAGLFGGTIGTVVLSIVGDITPIERRGRAMGIIMTGFSAAAALGVPAGLYFGIEFNWHFPFVAIVILGSFIWLMVFLFFPKLTDHLKAERKNTFATVRELFLDNNIVSSLVFVLFLMLGHFIIVPFISPYMVANVGFAEKDLTLIYLIGGSLTFVTSPVIGFLSDKYGKSKVYVILGVLSFIPLYWITHLMPSSTFMVLLCSTLFFIFSGSRFVPGMAVVLGAVKPENRGVFMGIRSSVQMLGSGLAAAIAGKIMINQADGTYANYDTIGYLAIAFTLISMLIVKKIKSKY